MSDQSHPNWPDVRLGDHARVKARLGWKGLKAEEYVLDGPIFLAAPNLRGGRIDFDNVDHLTQWRYEESPEIQLAVGDVLLVKDGSTLGMSGIVKNLPAPTTVNGSIAVLRPGASLTGDFLFYSINGQKFQRLIWLRRAGLGVPHLFQADLREFRISLPSLAEQNKIAEILSTLDRTIEQTEALIAKYQQIKAGLMQDLFTRGVTTNGHLRPSHPQASHVYKDSPAGPVPKEWSIERIEGLAESIVDGPFGSNLKTEHYVAEAGVRVVRLQNIEDGTYNDRDRAFVSADHAASLARNEVRPGDILVAGLGEDNNVVGRACCYPDGLPNAINKADCFRLRCRESLVLDRFIMHFLNTNGARKQIRRFEQGVTRRRINTTNLRKVVVGLPSKAEQELIVTMLSSASKQLSACIDARDKLQCQKLGLMHDLLTGRVRVEVTESTELPA